MDPTHEQESLPLWHTWNNPILTTKQFQAHQSAISTHNTKSYNPSLGLATKAKACKGASQEWARESHFMLSCVQESGREWTFTLPNELPLWELESQWTLKSSKGDFRGQNSLDWDVPYIIEKLLERKCLKWAHNNFRGQNSLHWNVLYIIGKILERRCLKWACMTHLST